MLIEKYKKRKELIRVDLMSDISIVKCQDYNYKNIRKSIDDTFKNLGGVQKFIKPGMKVLLKINLLLGREPKAAVTTHPVIVEALTNIIHDAGGIVIIADSPGGPYTQSLLSNVYKKCGIEKVARKTGALLNYNTSSENISFKEGKISKSFTIIKPALDADYIINLPKLKTHEMTYFTGAVKNLFGVIPGINKAEYHFRMNKKKDFANLLIDLCEFIKPNLTIMDAVVGMEGSGPSAGNPKKVGLIIAGENPYNVDFTATSIVGIKKDNVYTITESIERKLCIDNLDSLNIIGANIEDIYINDFKKPEGKSVAFLDMLPDFLKKPLSLLVSPKPVIDYNKCIGCGICEQNCPAKVIEMKDGKPNIKLNDCIRCFCCHELCPEKVVEVKRPLLMKLIIK